MLKVYETPCKNCLFHRNSIVPRDGVAAHLATCKARDTHFICHVPSDGEGFSVGGEGDPKTEVVCAGFYAQHCDPGSPLYGTGA